MPASSTSAVLPLAPTPLAVTDLTNLGTLKPLVDGASEGTSEDKSEGASEGTSEDKLEGASEGTPKGVIDSNGGSAVGASEGSATAGALEVALLLLLGDADCTTLAVTGTVVATLPLLGAAGAAVAVKSGALVAVLFGPPGAAVVPALVVGPFVTMVLLVLFLLLLGPTWTGTCVEPLGACVVELAPLLPWFGPLSPFAATCGKRMCNDSQSSVVKRKTTMVEILLSFMVLLALKGRWRMDVRLEEAANCDY